VLTEPINSRIVAHSETGTLNRTLHRRGTAIRKITGPIFVLDGGEIQKHK